jgi:hypothetical protein
MPWRTAEAVPVTLSRILSASLVLAMIDLSLPPNRCVLPDPIQRPLPPEAALDFDVRYDILLGDRVSQNRQIASVKEVKDPIVYPPLTNPEFVNSIPQQIRQWSP